MVTASPSGLESSFVEGHIISRGAARGTRYRSSKKAGMGAAIGTPARRSTGLVSETQVTQNPQPTAGACPGLSLYHHRVFRGSCSISSAKSWRSAPCLVPIFVRKVRGLGQTLYVAHGPTQATKKAQAEVSQFSGLPGARHDRSSERHPLGHPCLLRRGAKEASSLTRRRVAEVDRRAHLRASARNRQSARAGANPLAAKPAPSAVAAACSGDGPPPATPSIREQRERAIRPSTASRSKAPTAHRPSKAYEIPHATARQGSTVW